MRPSFTENMRVSREVGTHLIPSSDREKKVATKNMILSVVSPGSQEAPGTSMDASAATRLSKKEGAINRFRLYQLLLVLSAPARDFRTLWMLWRRSRGAQS